MYNASSKYRKGIYATSRMNRGRVTFDVSDISAVDDVASVTSSVSQSSLSDRNQVVNKVRQSKYKLATWEKDRFKLDGSWSFADSTLANNGEIGFASSLIGDIGGGVYTKNLIGTDADFATFVGWTQQSGAVATITQGQSDPNGGTGATRIQTVGGTSTLKYYKSASNGVAGTPMTVSVWLKNQGPTVARVYTQFGSREDIPIGVWTKFVIPFTANGTSSRQLRFETQNVGDNLDIVAFQPQMTETDYEQAFVVGETTAPAVTVNFNGNHSSIGLTVTFDTVNNEYATDFNITAFDSGGDVVASYDYTGNTLAQVAAYGQLTNYRSVTVTVKRWNVPYRRVRIAEIDFGVVKVYTGESGLVSMQLNEEMDLISANLPSPEFKFTVDNSAREFNILNPQGFYKSLQQQQQVIGEIGLTYDTGDIEWIPVGEYLLWEWQSDEGSLTSSFYARTPLDIMANITYEKLTATSQSLTALAQSIFALCGITKYSIDPSLSSITTNSLIQKTNCKEVLQMIAIAGCANVYVTRDNVIKIEPVATAVKTSKVRFIRDWMNGNTANAGNHWVEIMALDKAGVNVALGKTVTGSSNERSAEPYSNITDGDTAYGSYGRSGDGLQNVVVDLGAVYDISTVKIYHYWNTGRTYHQTKTEVSDDGVNWVTLFDSAVSGEYPETSSGRTYATAVDNVSLNDQYVEPKIVLEQPVKQVDVTYWTNLSTSAVTSVTSGADVGDTFKLERNTLINTSARATAVANWILAQKNNRAVYTMNWRGNQAHELGDLVGIGNSYGTDTSAILTRTELKYQGYLQATTEAKGVV